MQPIVSGIYWIRNTVNNHIYIGSSKNIYNRIQRHRWELRNNRHKNIHLQSAYILYGEHCFEFLPILSCNIDVLAWYEQQFIDQWKPEYNIQPTAFSNLGNKHTEETKQLLSQKVGAINKLQYRREQTATTNKERVWTYDARRALGERNKQVIWTQERKEKVVIKMQKTYNGILSPTGHVYNNIHNLKKFCRLYDLDPSNMYNVMNGKLKTYRGWSKCDL